MLPLIEVRALSKRFYKNKKEDIHAIRHVSFNIEKGDIVGIIGRSGAGKSTLIRCLAGLENPTFGQILFNGNDIAEMGAESVRNYRKQIGMIFQQFNLLNSRTVAQNISYPLEIHHVPKEESNRRVAELIALVGLQEQKDAYPAQLSGGQKQRVGIARALAYEPEILYCDEATSALDPNTSREILHLLKSIHKKLGITIVLITHEMEVIKQICNKVVVLEKGEVVEIGTISQLFSNPKHPVTKSLVLKTIHEIPAHFFQSTDPGCKLVHLHFRGEKADQPIITQMIKRFHIEANILLGWIDSLQSITVGNLILQLIGQPESVQHAMQFLKEQGIHVEVLEKQ